MIEPNRKRQRRASRSNPNVILSLNEEDETMPALVAERNSLVTDEVFHDRRANIMDAVGTPTNFKALTNGSEAFNSVQHSKTIG